MWRSPEPLVPLRGTFHAGTRLCNLTPLPGTRPMNKPYRLLLVLPLVAALGACMAPTDPGLPGEEERPDDHKDGQSFNSSLQAPAFLA